MLKCVSKGCRPSKTQDLTLLTFLTRRIWAPEFLAAVLSGSGGGSGGGRLGVGRRQAGGRAAAGWGSGGGERPRRASKPSKVSSLAFSTSSFSFDTFDNSREKRQVLKCVSKGCRPSKTQDLTLLTFLTRRIWAPEFLAAVLSCRAERRGGGGRSVGAAAGGAAGGASGGGGRGVGREMRQNRQRCQV